MSNLLYSYDNVNRRPHILSTDTADILLRDGSVALTANWNVGANEIFSSSAPSTGNSLTNRTYVDAQVSALAGPFGSKNAFGGVANAADPAGVSVGTRFLVVAGYTSGSAGVLVAGDVIEQDSVDPTFTKVVLSDGDVYIAKVELTGSTVVTSDSSLINDSEIAVWDVTTSKWVTVGSVVAIPDATAASGGGTKGKVSFDSDLGMAVTSGVASIKVDGTTVTFNGSGQLQVSAGGIDHAQLDNLDSASYSHPTAVQLADLTDAGDSTLHYHASDRSRANHTGTQASTTISDFTEAAQDAAAAMWGTGSHTAFEITYNDASDQLNAAVRYDNVTIGLVNNNLTVLGSGELAPTFTNNTGGELVAGTLVSLHTVENEIIVSDSNDIDKADTLGVVKSNIADGATGKVIIGGNATVNTDGVDLDIGKWAYVGGDAAAGKASKYNTGSYYEVKLGIASATNKVVLQKQWIG